VKRVLIVVAVLALATASAAFATKPGSGSPEGRALVFAPNPVQDLGNQDLSDQKDAANAVPHAAYHSVTLTDLDGSGFLRGKWATIVSETGNPAYSTTNTFLYDRHQDEFEQVMAYYWVTEAQRYIQSLAFRSGGPLRPINERPQHIRINQGGSTTRSRRTSRTSSASGRAGSTTPRTARSSSTSTGTRSTSRRASSSPPRKPWRSAKGSATTGP
jgi:zinc metalloprotease ZmpB